MMLIASAVTLCDPFVCGDLLFTMNSEFNLVFSSSSCFVFHQFVDTISCVLNAAALCESSGRTPRIDKFLRCALCGADFYWANTACSWCPLQLSLLFSSALRHIYLL